MHITNRKIHLLSLLLFVSSILYSGELSFPQEEFSNSSDTSEFQKYHRAYDHYLDRNNDSALVFVTEAIEIARKKNIKTTETDFLIKSAMIFDRMGNNDKAIENFEKAYQISLEIKNYENAATALNNLGSVHIVINKPDKAAEFLFKALNIVEEHSLEEPIGSIYTNLGLLFFYQEEWDKSIDYYYLAIPFYLQNSKYKSLALIYNNIGISYYYIGILDSVLYNFEKSLEMYVELDDKFGQTRPLYNIGEIYYTQGNYNKAFEYYNKSLNIEKEIGYVKGVAISLCNIGISYAEIEQYEKAKKYLFESIPLLDSVDDKSTLKDAYQTLSLVFENSGDVSQALEYHRLCSDLKDSIYNIEKNKQVSKLEAIYQNEKKQQLIEFQTKELQNKTYRNIALIACLILTLGLAIQSMFSNKRKRKTNLLLHSKNIELEDKNQKITSSITYASLIQAAILPPQNLLEEFFPDNFIYFQPKDIVSGDFYWITKKKNSIIVAVADCTGHGVPGAFMSMLGMTFLNEIINNNNLTKPDAILNSLREKTINSLRPNEKKQDTRDGMDIALCNIDLSKQTIEYSGAYNPLIVLRENKIIKLNPDRMPIGYHPKKNGLFKCTTFHIEKGDTIYLYTDGFSDQFGGEKNKKLTIKNFHKLIIESSSLPIKEQRSYFEKFFVEWKGNKEQIDDVTVMGIRI